MNIRRFVQGVDEPVWVDVVNAARQERDDWRAITVEELLLEENRPNFDFGGRFIAESGGKPVGTVHANVDRFREDRKGFVYLDLAREFCSDESVQKLMQSALSELKARGMIIAQAQIDSREEQRIQLLERLDFKRIRVFSWMEMELADISWSIGENAQVIIRPLQKHLERDMEVLNWLDSECFKEHFNSRPKSLEETRYILLSTPYLQKQEVFFAVLNDVSIGFIGVGVDEKYNSEKKVKAGEVFTIGVLKSFRRTGIGLRLMLHGLETLKGKGMTKAMLGVDDNNPTKAMALYDKVGFSVKRRDFFFEREL